MIIQVSDIKVERTTVLFQFSEKNLDNNPQNWFVRLYYFSGLFFMNLHMFFPVISAQIAIASIPMDSTSLKCKVYYPTALGLSLYPRTHR